MRNPNGSRSRHYTLARWIMSHQRSVRKLFVIVRMKDRRVTKSLMRLFEQCGILLYGTYDSLLLDKDVLLRIYPQRTLAARKFYRLMGKVRGQTGWPVLTAKGVNWNTPVAEWDKEKTSWIRQYFAEIGMSSYRPANACRIVNIHGGYFFTFADLRFAVAKPLIDVDGDSTDATLLREGELVHLVCNQGKVHPQHYWRAPLVGPFTDWSDMHRLGKQVFLKSPCLWSFTIS